jgi:murein DD-endopeptidase MepM/ murein hydrolase activator NlpD
MPWIMPLPEGTYRIGSRFGLRVAPIGVRKVESHNGLDFRAPSGTPVLAVDAGTVIERNDDPGANAGLYLKVTHADGRVSSYCHLSEIAVPLSARVRQGEQIGRVGSTGKSTGPHLHFVARVGGKVVDPLSVLPAV